MSDDRFNQGQHPIDRRQNQGQQQEDNYSEDDKTQLVDLDAIRSGGGGGADEPQFAPPPTMDSMPPIDAEDKTELFEIPKSLDGSGDGAITSSAPDYGSSSFDQGPNSPNHPPSASHQGAPGHSNAPHSQGGGYGQQNQHNPPPAQGGGYGQQNQHNPPPAPGGGYGQQNQSHQSQPGSVGGNFSSVDSGAGGFDDSFSSAPSSGDGREQVYIPGDDNASPAGATAFVNIADFAKEEAHFTPEQEAAGYDGSTQFVDVNALMAGNESDGGDPIDNDEDLHRGYQFEAEDIQRGDITLIEAKNALGKEVLLKRIWEGRPEAMSTPLRERIAQLHDLNHPNLVTMHGMFVSDSGMWVELQSPRGETLTEILQDGGALPADSTIELLEPVAELLETIHLEQLAYANLTTDSIWIDNQGKVLLEPFDMLKLEDRGNLGAFGPPEMDAPAEQRELSPASDVFSLAAVIAACITGLPLQASNLADYDDQKLIDKLQDGLASDPTERPQSTVEFLNNLQGSDGPDIKVVGAGILAIMMITGVGFVLLADDDPPPQPPPEQAQAQGADDAEAQEPADSARADESAHHPSVELPGSVSGDPRLTVTTSFGQNPPAEALTSASDRVLDEWRQSAQEAIEEAENASSRSDELKHYSDALEHLSNLIRHQEDPEDDWETLHEIYAKDAVRDELDEIIDSVSEALLDGRIGIANRRYAQFSALDPRATAGSFLASHNSAEIIELSSNDDDD